MMSSGTAVRSAIRLTVPTQTAQGQNLLLLLVVQDVAHPDEGLQSHRPRQRLGRRQLIAGFGCPPRSRYQAGRAGTLRLLRLAA